MSWDFVMASKAMQQMQLCDNLMVIQTLPLYNISAQQTIDIAQQQDRWRCVATCALLPFT